MNRKDVVEYLRSNFDFFNSLKLAGRYDELWSTSERLSIIISNTSMFVYDVDMVMDEEILIHSVLLSDLTFNRFNTNNPLNIINNFIKET